MPKEDISFYLSQTRRLCARAKKVRIRMVKAPYSVVLEANPTKGAWPRVWVNSALS